MSIAALKQTPVNLSARILAVDDAPSNLALLERILERSGYTHVDTIGRSCQVLAYFEQHPPDLLLLDLHMPDPDGFEVMRLLERWTRGETYVPILVLTADAAPSTRHRALEAGARDFLTKPFDQIEVLLRIGNLLQTRQLQIELQDQNAQLDVKVRRRTSELNEARLEAFRKLSLAAEYRDDETRQHTRRVGHIAALVALESGIDEADAEILREVAPLHDIGKIGIPDSILLKPGRLSDREFSTMKQHTRIGAGILGGTRSPFFTSARQIALSHHERWDGSGYPDGIAGERIPRAARIVALVDAFDAMSHQRPYKPAYPLEQTREEIERASGSHFDPAIVAAFRRLDHASLLDLPSDTAPPTLSSSAWDALRESKTLDPLLFEGVFDALPHGLLIATGERYCIAGNAVALHLLGIAAGELEHRRIDDLTPPEHRDELEAIWHALEGAGASEGFLLSSHGQALRVRYEAHPHLLAGQSMTVLGWIAGGRGVRRPLG